MFLYATTWSESIAQASQQSQVGKRLPTAFYIHLSALPHLPAALQAIEHHARASLSPFPPATLVKFSLDQPTLAYLYYPDFDTDPHPQLHSSFQINLETHAIRSRDYSHTANPPVLHRKETFVAPDYPRYADFVWLTQQEESLGLLDQSRTIGFQHAWEQRLRDRHLILHDHCLACPLTQPATPPPPQIHRHKAAIVRTTASKPLRLAVKAELFTPDATYFDYGCGHGADIK